MTTDIRQQKKIQAELEAANRDLRENRATLEKEKIKLETILFGIGDCVTIFDLDGNLMLSNPRGMQLRGGRVAPLLPLQSGAQQEITLHVDNSQHRFLGQVEAIRDSEGTPFAFVEVLKDITDQLRLEEREQELLRIKRQLRHGDLRSEMVGTSAAMQRVFDLTLRCAEVDSSVLILGETGVGKEMVARAIHTRSERSDNAFVAVNCGALPETLLESELFGHVKGAFTGAVSGRVGLFREADGGTLFLDEVGDICGPLQVKLLRALQEQEIRPVGGDKSYPVDVRVITATNKNLDELVAEGVFRKDLYYRIAVIPLLIPPLRERMDDILPLAEHFMKKHGKKKGGPPRLNHAAQQKLLDYSWPGNIRELENAVEHAFAMARGPVITPEELPVHVAIPYHMGSHKKAQINLMQKSIEAEKEAIVAALQESNGNRARAARELGISRTTLWRKITMYNLL
jgi:transcriptional regulator with PAS, ATPase and Fis domain